MPAPQITQGVTHSGSLVSANVRPDIERVLQVLKPYQSPFLQILWFYNRPAKEVRNAYGRFSWFENEFFPHQAAVTAPIEAQGSPQKLLLNASNISAPDIFQMDDIILIEETDQMGFVSAKSPGQATISSIDGTGDLRTITEASGFIKVIGSRNSEYAGTRQAVTTKEVEQYNYLTIFSESIATTGRAQAGEHYTDGLTHDELVEKRIEEMKLQIERYLLFAPEQGYATAGNYRTTWGHGFMGRIKSNINNYNSTLTEDAFDEHLKEVFARGSNRRLHICGSNQLAAINRFVKSRYELNPQPAIKAYGIRLQEYLTPFGVVDLLWNPVMDGKFSDFGFTIDTDRVRLRYMAPDKKGSRKFRIEENVETPGIDGTTTKILFDVGLEIHNEECHGILRKV